MNGTQELGNEHERNSLLSPDARNEIAKSNIAICELNRARDAVVAANSKDNSQFIFYPRALECVAIAFLKAKSTFTFIHFSKLPLVIFPDALNIRML